MEGRRVPIVMKLMTPEKAMENKQWQVRNTFQEVQDEKLGKYVLSSNFVKMSESPPRVKWVSSEIGQDNDYIREKYLKKTGMLLGFVVQQIGILSVCRRSAFGTLQSARARPVFADP